MDQLSPEQHKILSELVAIPSWRLDRDPLLDERAVLEYIEAKLRSMNIDDCYIERQMFDSRVVQEIVVHQQQIIHEDTGPRSNVRDVFTMPLSPVEAANYTDERLRQFCPDSSFFAEKHERNVQLWNLIVEKGSGTEFTVMVYAHIDTVIPADIDSQQEHKWEWNKLVRDGGYLKGLGSYDMKGGAMVAMDLLQRVNVPKGMKLIVVFSPDEEGNSEGARKLLKWSGLKKVDLVLSPEIATIYNRSEADKPKDIITARVGHAKTIAEFEVPQAHAFRKNVTEAEEAAHEMRDHLRKWFYEEQSRRSHPYFGDVLEELKIKEYTVPRAPGFSNTTYGRIGISQFILPGNALLSAFAEQSACMERLAAEREWAKKSIEYRLAIDPNLTSYEPYIVPMQSSVARAVVDGVDAFYESHKKKAGRSTSDMNILMPWFIQQGRPVPCIEVGPVGLGAHSTLEAVLESSLVKLIDWYHFMITKHLPEHLDKQRNTRVNMVMEDDNGEETQG